MSKDSLFIETRHGHKLDVRIANAPQVQLQSLKFSKAQAKIAAQFLSTGKTPTEVDAFDWHFVSSAILSSRLATDVTTVEDTVTPNLVMSMKPGDFSSLYSRLRPKFWTRETFLASVAVFSALVATASFVWNVKIGISSNPRLPSTVISPSSDELNK